MSLIPVKGMDGFYRDSNSQAIINKNNQDYQAYVANRAKLLSDKERIDKLERGQELVNSLKSRINNIRGKQFDVKPKVLGIEWIKPFFTSGHWVPDMIDYAGGENMITKSGEHSRKMDIEEIEDADPDFLILMPCGFDVQRTISEYEKYLKKDSRWNELRAVKENNVFAVDANSFFSKPSIRVITGIEILSKILHPEKFAGLEVPSNSFLKI